MAFSFRPSFLLSFLFAGTKLILNHRNEQYWWIEWGGSRPIATLCFYWIIFVCYRFALVAVYFLFYGDLGRENCSVNPLFLSFSLSLFLFFSSSLSFFLSFFLSVCLSVFGFPLSSAMARVKIPRHATNHRLNSHKIPISFLRLHGGWC